MSSEALFSFVFVRVSAAFLSLYADPSTGCSSREKRDVVSPSLREDMGEFMDLNVSHAYLQLDGDIQKCCGRKMTPLSTDISLFCPSVPLLLLFYPLSITLHRVRPVERLMGASYPAQRASFFVILHPLITFWVINLM